MSLIANQFRELHQALLVAALRMGVATLRGLHQTRLGIDALAGFGHSEQKRAYLVGDQRFRGAVLLLCLLAREPRLLYLCRRAGVEQRHIQLQPYVADERPPAVGKPKRAGLR